MSKQSETGKRLQAIDNLSSAAMFLIATASSLAKIGDRGDNLCDIANWRAYQICREAEDLRAKVYHAVTGIDVSDTKNER